MLQSGCKLTGPESRILPDFPDAAELHPGYLLINAKKRPTHMSFPRTCFSRQLFQYRARLISARKVDLAFQGLG